MNDETIHKPTVIHLIRMLYFDLCGTDAGVKVLQILDKLDGLHTVEDRLTDDCILNGEFEDDDI